MAKTLLYVETASARYGSSLSLLTLVRSLDRARFRPVVAVQRDNPVREDFAAMGVQTMPLAVPDLRAPDIGTVKSETAGLAPPRAARFDNPLGLALREARDLAVYRHDIRALKRLIKSEGVDLIHCNNQVAANRLVYYAAPRGLPFIQHVRDGPLSTSAHIRKLGKRPDLFLCISHFVEAEVVKCVRADARTQVVYNPVGDRFFEPVRRARAAQAPYVFCQVARLIPYKGQDLLLQAFAALQSRLPDGVPPPRLVLLGGATHGAGFERELRRFVDDNRLGALVDFRPYENDIIPTLDSVDCLVHCTRGSEGFGRVVAEAMARGLPVIGNSRGALPELIDHRSTGFVADDVEAMASAMRTLIADRALSERMSKEARRRADRFSAETIAGQVTGAYDDLLGA